MKRKYDSLFATLVGLQVALHRQGIDPMPTLTFTDYRHLRRIQEALFEETGEHFDNDPPFGLRVWGFDIKVKGYEDQERQS